MLIKGSRGIVVDNSGAIEVEIFGIIGGSGKKATGLGQIVKVAVKSVQPGGKMKKGDTSYAIITGQKYHFNRKDGSFIKANQNSFVLIDSSKSDFVGTRFFGYIPKEAANYIKNKDFKKKMLSLIKEVY